MPDLPNGITRLAHVQQLLESAEYDLGVVRCRVDDGVRLTKLERDIFRRALAGVIGSLESVRIWLDAGAPR
jgi:hypothetical protein